MARISTTDTENKIPIDAIHPCTHLEQSSISHREGGLQSSKLPFGLSNFSMTNLGIYDQYVD